MGRVMRPEPGRYTAGAHFTIMRGVFVSLVGTAAIAPSVQMPLRGFTVVGGHARALFDHLIGELSAGGIAYGFPANRGFDSAPVGCQDRTYVPACVDYC